MSALDSAMERIKNKAELHRWLDEQDDDVCGVLITVRDDAEGNAIHTRRYIGDVSIAEAYWIAGVFQQFLMNVTRACDE